MAFFAEYSLRPGRIGKPDLYYGAVTLPEPAGGCPVGGGGSPPSEEQPPSQEPPPSEEPPPSGPPAEQPPASDSATLLGEERIGTQIDANRSGMAEAFQTTAATTGTVSSISLYVDENSTGERFAVGLYADADGHPGALLTQGAADAKPGDWNAVAVPDTAVTAGQRYWIALVGTGPGQIAFRDRPDSCHSETTHDGLDLDALPATWTTGTEYDDCPLSAYAAGA